MSWIECSMSVPPPALRDVLAPRRAVEALDREVLVVAHHGREQAAVARRDAMRVGQRSRTPAPTAARARPGAGRARARAATRSAAARSGASGFSQKIGDAAVGRGLDRLEVGGGPRADPHDVDRVEQRRRAIGAARRRGAARRLPARSGSSSNVAVSAASTSPASTSCCSATRARCRCGRSRRARSGSSSRSAPCSSVDERRRAGPRRVPKRSRTVVDRPLDRGSPLGAAPCVDRRRRRPRSSTACVAGAGRRAASSDTPSRRTPRVDVERGEELAGGRRATTRAEVGRLRRACAPACASRSRRSGPSA